MLAALLSRLRFQPQLLPRRVNKNCVLERFKFLQENLFFIFDGEVYRQTKGTCMGKIYAPSLADIKVGYDEIILEQKLKDKMSAGAHEHFTGSYARYLDDVWLMWRLVTAATLSITNTGVFSYSGHTLNHQHRCNQLQCSATLSIPSTGVISSVATLSITNTGVISYSSHTLNNQHRCNQLQRPHPQSPAQV